MKTTAARLALLSEKTTVALSRRLNLRTKDEPAVTEILTEAFTDASTLGAPIVPPLSDLEIELFRSVVRATISPLTSTTTYDNGTLHL